MKNTIIKIGLLCFLVAGCSRQTDDVQSFADKIENRFPDASITILSTTQPGKRYLDYRVIFSNQKLPSAKKLVEYFESNNKDLYTLTKKQKMMQTSIIFGIPHKGIRFQMHCINQGMVMCDIGKRTLNGFSVLYSSFYE